MKVLLFALAFVLLAACAAPAAPPTAPPTPTPRPIVFADPKFVFQGEDPGIPGSSPTTRAPRSKTCISIPAR